jgi:hypothetical protein
MASSLSSPFSPTTGVAADLASFRQRFPANHRSPSWREATAAYNNDDSSSFQYDADEILAQAQDNSLGYRIDDFIQFRDYED